MRKSNREQWMEGIRRKGYREKRIVAEKNFFGLKDTYCVAENFSSN